MLGTALAASAASPDRPGGAFPATDRAHESAGSGELLEAWHALHFSGGGWLTRFSADLEIQTRGRGIPPASEGRSDWVAELRTSLDSRLLTDKSSRLRAHFDPITGVVRRLSQLSMGPRPDFKRYEFGPRGVTRVRSEPPPDRPLEPPERWPRSPESFHAYDLEALGCRLVSNPAALAWWLTWGPAAKTVRSEDPGACYFLGKTLYRVELTSIGTTTERVDYRLVREGRSRRRRGRLRVERFAVTSHPIAGKLDEKTIVAEIALDAENRLPWRFVMRDGPLRIDVELERASLRGPSIGPR